MVTPPLDSPLIGKENWPDSSMPADTKQARVEKSKKRKGKEQAPALDTYAFEKLLVSPLCPVQLRPHAPSLYRKAGYSGVGMRTCRDSLAVLEHASRVQHPYSLHMNRILLLAPLLLQCIVNAFGVAGGSLGSAQTARHALRLLFTLLCTMLIIATG